MREGIRLGFNTKGDHGLEWLYRFSQEPKRLFRRYFMEDVKIVKLIKKYWGWVIAQCNRIFSVRLVVTGQVALAAGKECMTYLCTIHRRNEVSCR